MEIRNYIFIIVKNYFCPLIGVRSESYGLQIIPFNKLDKESYLLKLVGMSHPWPWNHEAILDFSQKLHTV